MRQRGVTIDTVRSVIRENLAGPMANFRAIVNTGSGRRQLISAACYTSMSKSASDTARSFFTGARMYDLLQTQAALVWHLDGILTGGGLIAGGIFGNSARPSLVVALHATEALQYVEGATPMDVILQVAKDYGSPEVQTAIEHGTFQRVLRGRHGGVLDQPLIDANSRISKIFLGDGQSQKLGPLRAILQTSAIDQAAKGVLDSLELQAHASGLGGSWNFYLLVLDLVRLGFYGPLFVDNIRAWYRQRGRVITKDRAGDAQLAGYAVNSHRTRLVCNGVLSWTVYRSAASILTTTASKVSGDAFYTALAAFTTSLQDNARLVAMGVVGITAALHDVYWISRDWRTGENLSWRSWTLGLYSLFRAYQQRSIGQYIAQTSWFDRVGIALSAGAWLSALFLPSASWLFSGGLGSMADFQMRTSLDVGWTMLGQAAQGLGILFSNLGSVVAAGGAMSFTVALGIVGLIAATAWSASYAHQWWTGARGAIHQDTPVYIAASTAGVVIIAVTVAGVVVPRIL
jgi:hypothetical protein